MTTETFTYERHTRGESPWALSVARVLPEGEPRFVVQIVHGFSERKERWIPFMQVIAACGGIALIHDLRGHGATRCIAEDPKPGDELARFGYDRATLFDDIDHVFDAYGCPWKWDAQGREEPEESAVEEQTAETVAEAPDPAQPKEETVTESAETAQNTDESSEFTLTEEEDHAEAPEIAADSPENTQNSEEASAEPSGSAEPRAIPRFLFGHSMGALIAGLYAAHEDRRGQIDGLILTGLPHRERFISFGLAYLDFLGFFGGDGAKPKRLNRAAFTRYNRGFEPDSASDGFLWITNDPAVRCAFAADPLCNREHPLMDYKNLLRLVRDFYRPASWDKPPKDFPVLLMAGENDPIAGGDARMLDAQKFLQDMGFASVDTRMYRDGRHEIFFDTGKEAPYTDAIRFVMNHLPQDCVPEEHS